MDLEAGELRRSGVKVALQDQPFRVLTLLLENPGKLVSREEIQQKLWPGDTFVEFDRGLNTAINKVREALGDSAASPRFIETVPRRGYRFLAQVDGIGAPVQNAAGNASDNSRYRRAVLLLAALSVGLAGALGFIEWRELNSPQPVEKLPLLKFALSPESLMSSGDTPRALPAISPDGRQIAYVSGNASRWELWVWQLDRNEGRQIASGDGRPHPAPFVFWSPAGDFIAFPAGGLLKKVSVRDGTGATICRLPAGEIFVGATWSPDGNSVVFSTGWKPGRTYEVPAQGGNPRLVIEPEKGNELYTPHFLPAGTGQRLLLASTTAEESQIVLQNLVTGQRKVLTDGWSPRYSPSGHIIYQKNYSRPGLWAIPFSLKTLEPTGAGFPIAQNGIYPSVADDGTLIYLEQGRAEKTRLVWRNREGRKIGEIGKPQQEMYLPSLSPDGRFVAVEGVERETGEDIWVHDVARPVKVRLTLDPARESYPFWSPNGKEVGFWSLRYGYMSLFTVVSDGSKAAKPVLVDGKPLRAFLADWSPDGSILANYTSDGSLCYIKRGAGGEGWKAIPLSFRAGFPKFSPDGRFLAYVSDEAGGKEVYVRAFPNGGDKRQISQSRGGQPRWSKNGRELFYVEGDALFAVPVSTKPAFSMGTAKRLFSDSGLVWGWAAPAYDVSADGQRFVTMEPVGPLRKSTIHVVLNWFAEFSAKHR